MLTDVTNWRGLPDVASDGVPLPDWHGSVVGDELLRTERSMVVRGAVVGRDVTEAAELLGRLERAVADRTVELKVADASGVWSRWVEVGPFQPVDRAYRSTVEFTMDVIARDPLRYSERILLGPVGPPVRSGGLVLPAALPWNLGTSEVPRLVVENPGVVPVRPLLRVMGSGSSVVVSGVGRRLAFGEFSGELVFDAARRRAFLNGRDVTIDLVERGWPAVPVGSSGEFFFEVAGPAGSELWCDFVIGEW